VDREWVGAVSLRRTNVAAAVPELIDIETLAHLLGDSVRRVRRLVAERRVPYLKVGHFVRFDPAEIVEWLDSARHPGRVDRPGPGHRPGRHA
jgi:excisionase family DNA binding protein